VPTPFLPLSAFTDLVRCWYVLQLVHTPQALRRFGALRFSFVFESDNLRCRKNLETHRQCLRPGLSERRRGLSFVYSSVAQRHVHMTLPLVHAPSLRVIPSPVRWRRVCTADSHRQPFVLKARLAARTGSLAWDAGNRFLDWEAPATYTCCNIAPISQ
jgi:hypothetical protein